MENVIEWFSEQLGTILGALGLISGFVFYWISRKPKRFGWQGISSTELVSFKGRYLPMKITYEDKDVYSPNIIVIRLGNIGKSPIRSSDYDGPVQISFTKGDLLAYDVSGKLHEQISLEVTKENDTSILVVPSLLNPGEWFDLQFVTDGPIEVPTVTARIAGQTGPIEEEVAKQEKKWRVFHRISMFFFVGIPSLGIFASAFFNEEFTKFFPFIIVFGVLIVSVSTFQRSRKPAWSKRPSTKRREKNK